MGVNKFHRHVLPLFLLLSIAFVAGQSEEDDLKKDANVIKLSALGRSVRLGSLYDAYSETFTGVSLLTRELPSRLISKTETPSTNTRFGVMKSYSDKSSFMDVSASLSLSVLSGKVEISGSGKFLQDEQKKSNSVVGSLRYETTTCEEVLEIFYDEMRDFISMPVLNTTTETHLVIGAGYGANVYVKMEDSNEENREVTEIQGKMKISLQIVGFGGISASASVDIGETDLSSFSSYTMHLFGDVSLGESDHPTNVVKMIGLVEKIPELIKMSDEGKGRALFYYLLPLGKVWEFMQYKDNNGTEIEEPAPIPPSIAEPPPEIPPDVVDSQIQVFEQINIVTLKLNDLSTSMMNSRDILNNTDLHRLKDLRREFMNSTGTYKTKLRAALMTRVRGHAQLSAEVKAIEMGLRKGRDYDMSLEDTETVIDEEFQDVRLKLEMADFLTSRGAVWVGREDLVDTSILKVFKEHGTNVTLCSIHFYREYLADTLEFTLPVIEAQAKNHTALIVDCDHPHPTCSAEASHFKVCTLLYSP